ncbi:MAG: ATP-binding protein [candidate division KSB1 bacterium]|nr:ATP-binding protein [candidate division KSB1 bacterium]
MEANLLLQNPWWEGVERINEDLYLKRLTALPFQYQPTAITPEDLMSSGVMTLRGPRQVGKTTLLKLLIRQLLQQGHPPQNIFYFTTELVANEKELFDIFKSYLDFAPEGKHFVFFDEITTVPRWEYAIKHIIDIGLGENVLFILTGSSSFDLRRGGERLPGRRQVPEPDRVLLPLSFRQYCLMQDFKELESINLREWQESILQALPKLRIFFPKIQSYFKEYLLHGGFLIAMADFLQQRMITQPTLETYRTVVISDFEKLRKDRIILRNIIRHLLDTLSTPISWNGLARDLGSISGNTVKEYVQLLADSYLLYILEFLEKGRQQPNVRKNKKLFPYDPLIYQIFANIAGREINSSLEFESKKIEGLVGSALIRNTEGELFQGFASLGSTFYWRSAYGKEIDFVVLWNEEEIPIEVKYQTHVSPINYITIKRSFGKGLVLTRDSFFQDEKVIGIPVSCFLYLLPE